MKLRSSHFDRLVAELHRSIRKRRTATRRWLMAGLDKGDIVYHLQSARDGGDLDEACWRAFLAGHFGRSSTNEQPAEGDSAGRLLCAFGPNPFWKWKTVHKNPKAFYDWLSNNDVALRTLVFGNHRKYESKKPKNLFRVIESFLALVAQHDDLPSKLFEVAASDANDATQRFSKLFHRLRDVWRFGRTARFDLLTLMSDLGLLHAEPGSCYLRGSTGPLAGARKLWGDRAIDDLEVRAVDLAAFVNVSPHVIEDALCNWQKPWGNDH
jgi:hypothetical protein